MSSHSLSPSILQSPLPHQRTRKQTQLAVMMTNQPKYLCPSSFTLARPTSRSTLFLYGSLCSGHLTRSQTVVIALHKHTSALVMSPKHQLTVNVHNGPSLQLSEEWYKHGRSRCAYVDGCVGLVTNLFGKCDVSCILYNGRKTACSQISFCRQWMLS